ADPRRAGRAPPAARHRRRRRHRGEGRGPGEHHVDDGPGDARPARRRAGRPRRRRLLGAQALRQAAVRRRHPPRRHARLPRGPRRRRAARRRRHARPGPPGVRRHRGGGPRRRRHGRGAEPGQRRRPRRRRARRPARRAGHAGPPPGRGPGGRPLGRPHPRVGHQLAAADRPLRLAARDHVRGPGLRRPPRRRGVRQHGGTRPMSSATTTEIEVFSGAPAPPPHRPRVLLVGTAYAAGASATAVLALIALYARWRADVLARGEVWLPEEATLQLSPGTMGMATLLLSLPMVAWIVHALRNDDRGHALMAYGVTLVLGVAYINGVAYGWQQL